MFDRLFNRQNRYRDKSEALYEILEEKNRIISIQEKDMESLKREIVSLKQKLNNSDGKKK